MLRIFTDGSGKTGKYIYLVEETSRVRIFQQKGITNNQAEYLAIIEALKAFPNEDVEIISDSELAVKQLRTEYVIKDDTLRDLAQKVWELAGGRKVTFTHVLRKKKQSWESPGLRI